MVIWIVLVKSIENVGKWWGVDYVWDVILLNIFFV